MPIYEYTCPECGDQERLVPMAERNAQRCQCGEKLDRVTIPTNVSAHFKGPGFYCNDYPHG